MAVRKDTVQLEVIINGTKAGGTLKDMRGNIRDLKRELDKLTIGTKEYNDKAAELARATAAMNTHTKAIREQTAVIENGGKRVNSFTDTLKKGAIAAGLFFGTQQIIQWGKQFVGWVFRGTAALEDMRDKSQAVFRDGIDIVEDFAAINAQQLGVTEEKYVSLASQIGALLVPMGFAREEAAQMSAEALNLTGALSEWTLGTVDLEKTQQILGKALLGQTKGLKQLGINISEADIQTRLAADGTDKLTGAQLKQAKAQATLALIQEQSVDAQRDFAASQQDIGRSTGRLSAAFAQLQENFLSKLLPGIKSFTNTIADSISPLKQQSDLVEESKDKINTLARTIQSGNLSYEGRKKALSEINALLPPHIAQLDVESTSNEQLAIKINEVNAAMDQRIANLLREEKVLEASRRQQTAKDDKDTAARRLAEQEELQKKLAAQRSVGANIGAGGLDQGQAERRNNGALIEARRVLKVATEELALAETHLLYVRNQNSDIAEEVLGREAAAAAEKERLAAENAKKEAELLAKELAEKEKQAREERFRRQLKSIEDQYNKERQIKIQSIEFLRENEELYAAERERINLEADVKIANAQAALYKKGSIENLQLLQTALDKEAEIRKDAAKLATDQREEQINRESELTKLHLREEISDREELTRKLEIEELSAQQRIASVRLAGLDDADAEYIKLYNEITDRQLEIDRRKQADVQAITESGLQVRQELAIKALHELELEEEDFNKARELIALETDIAILQSRMVLYKEGSEERLAIENALAEKLKALNGVTFQIPDRAASSGGSSTPEDRDKERTRREEIGEAALDVATGLANSMLDIDRQRIDDQLELELNALDELTAAKLGAAEGDAVLQKKIIAQAARDRAAIEKEAAKKRKDLAYKEGIVQVALSVIEALPNAAAAVSAGILGALQLKVIDSQSFADGGYTPTKGLYKDKSGHEVTGVSHDGEWYAPKWMVKHPVYGADVAYLENVRRNKGSFAEGGFTTVSTRPTQYVQTVTSSMPVQEIKETNNILREILAATKAYPTQLEANVSYMEIEKKGESLNRIRGLSQS